VRSQDRLEGGLEGGVFGSPFEASSSAFESARALIQIVTLNDKRPRPPNEVYGEITLLAVDCLWPTFVAGPGPGAVSSKGGSPSEVLELVLGCDLAFAQFRDFNPYVAELLGIYKTKIIFC
jgi:hypothetical protein